METSDNDRDRTSTDRSSDDTGREPRDAAVPRSSVLRGGALALGAGTLGAAALVQARGAQRADAAPRPRPNPHYRRPRVSRIATLSGPGVTSDYGFEATDLGVPCRTPDGRILAVFGDTFEGAKVGSGRWTSPVALYAKDRRRPSASGLRWSGAVGGERAEQLIDYDHEGPISTYLPGDVITVDGTMYLWVMANAGFGNVARTEIWTSKDSGETWEQTTEMFPGDHLAGFCQQATWSLDEDGGTVHLLTSGFQRDKGAILQRVPASKILDPDAYETYGPVEADGTSWEWGKAPKPIIDGSIGEMCLRRVEDRTVLTYFNSGLYRIDLKAATSPEELRDAAFSETLLWGCDWGHEDDERVAQLYGGYIVPGSTLDDLHLTVSQWHTGPDWPYHVEEFRVQGLEKGIRAES
ncbi:DUF4185 domain-containing protein [Brachybacterium endophyticum]|uniref:DUF4185 domain-containing protein n=1 Tax=Brachybacterium endophyticum TaxID=2182385 RepID=UPI00196BAD5D|nr:DUF4185 domain-containing protein [Brachybacterium endophyticum]